MISIIDYSIGNCKSILNMLNFISVKSKITNDPNDLKISSHIILPGVGDFDTAINSLKSNKLLYNGIIDAIQVDKIPTLGICLGMQLFFEKSEEGNETGLGLIPGYIKKLNSNKRFKVPNMGWLDVVQTKKSILTKGLNPEPRFYFVHSYFASPTDDSHIILRSQHSVDFACAVQKNNIFGVQFHPEKSHKHGMNLLKNFSKITHEY